MKRLILALTLISIVALFWQFGARLSADSPRRGVIILGIDGMDPVLLNRFLDEKRLPNFQKLIDQGDFKPLQTTMPPLSPVAWATFITGTRPGRHGIYDFLHRDPKTLTPEFAMVKTEASDWNLNVGSWVFPLSGGNIETLRKGQAFWELLEDRDIPSTIFRMPVNFPPAEAGRSLSGMGTPDLLGTPGTFALFTTHPPTNADDITGGEVFEVEVVYDRMESQITGPPNTFRRFEKETAGGEIDYEIPPMTEDFEVFLDPDDEVAKVILQDNEFILKKGEWSDWVSFDFEALPYVVSVSAVCRFYLQDVRPEFRLYMTPLQINSENPAMPITYPDDWASDLHESLGHFYTQELPEDTKAFSGGVFTGREFWEQSQFVYREQRKALDYALDNYDGEGLLFFYFSSVDQGSHMLWNFMDPEHPAYKEDEVLSGAIPTLYEEMDEALGRVLETADDDTTVIVMSDHGFSPFYWEVNLNSWLADKGYTGLVRPDRRDGFPLYTNVDWSRTKAYALGLNGLYVNLRGRESRGIVSQGEDYEQLLDEIERDLLALVDPRNGNQVVSYVLRTGRDFSGADLQSAPDMIIGYSRGYRSSWKSPLGEYPREIFVDNMDPWSGDHSIDFREVPGILVTNRTISLEEPALYDLTVAVLDELGVEKGSAMIGRDCLK